MRIETHFRRLDPPRGGWSRLQDRLHRPSHTYRWAPALAAAVLVSVVVFWLWPDSEKAAHRQLAEVRAVIEDAQRPPITIDEHEPVALNVSDENIKIYWVYAQD